MPDCYICQRLLEFGDPPPAWSSAAVAICNGLQRPVSAHHAFYCAEEGHGAITLPQPPPPPASITVAKADCSG